MKLKKRVKSLNDVDEKYHDLYTEVDGEFVLDVEGDEDTGALKRAKEHEKLRRKEAEQKARELQEQIDELNESLEEIKESGGKKKEGDDPLDKKWQAKLQKRESELNGQIEKLQTEIQRITVDTLAENMAKELSDSPNLLVPHIKSRLTMEMVDGKATVKVKDPDGELSASTLDELKAEFESSEDFASVIRGSQGSGSGASGGKGGGGEGKPSKPDFTKASPKEIADYLKANKGEAE